MKKFTFVIVLVFIVALTGSMYAGAVAPSFGDVPENHKDRTAIQYCASHGFVLGYSETSFKPDQAVTRAQFATVWGRTMQVRMHGFTDVTKPKNEAENSIFVMYALGLINGVSNTLFSTNARITREQAATVVVRTYLEGIDGGDAYTGYSDGEDISSYAQNAVSVCMTKGIFNGVFTGEDFKPAQALTRGELCHIIYNLFVKFYTVTIDPDIEGGSVSASPMNAEAGATITVNVIPGEDMRLVAGSLKFNSTVITGGSFTMPAANVVITAEFEPLPPPAATLSSIAITTPPDDTSYTVGESLDLSGMVVTATYSDESTLVVTDYTASPDDGTELATAGDIDITITYTEGDIEKTATQTVTVSSAT